MQELNTGKYFGVEPYRSVRSTLHVVKENMSVALYSEEVSFSPRRFYIDSFYEAYRKVFLDKSICFNFSSGKNNMKNTIESNMSLRAAYNVAFNKTVNRLRERKLLEKM